MRRSKEEVCFLMIQRKASNEIIEGTMSGAIAPTVQSTVPGSILKGRNKLVLKKIVETADENESEDGKPADVAVVRVANGSSKERDKTYHEK
jgi:hypothetical protein